MATPRAAGTSAASSIPLKLGQCRGRQPARDLADQGDAGPVKAEQNHDPGGQQHRDQWPRKAREPAVNSKQEQQHADRERQRRQVGLVELRGERTQLVEGRAAPRVDPGDLAELADDHQDGDAGQVADQHRTGQQAGQEPQPGDPPHDAQDPDGDRESRSRLGVTSAVPGHQGAHRRGRHQRCGRLGPDRELARRAEKGVDRQRRDDGPQAGDGRQTGNFGVRHHLRDQVGGDRHPGDHVAAQPAALVVTQLPQPGQQAIYPTRSSASRGVGRHTTNVPAPHGLPGSRAWLALRTLVPPPTGRMGLLPGPCCCQCEQVVVLPKEGGGNGQRDRGRSA